jgi:Holliday junction resolvase-like predicted endonuclease
MKKRLNLYAKGRRLEYKSMAMLACEGYRCLRTAGSHGEFDLLAFQPDHILLVQVKGNTKPSKSEIAKIRAFRCPSNCYKEIYIWKDGQKDVEILEV